ncbi:hypothetical protein SERLA73DRAFT_87798 [Serpula lacrymans var. lacrymans S7.3]|uniref:UspA domain-containing protein n=2 Tax=Serpula lacrymans var. lacrymans TaxID=341189 RepID=F8PSE3_SERL3|nr:uncharacterized protein SERLADRAFT_464529 [Serpula lacrymans var. lacrymans S7.9]EGO01273.1 hypothetical protein SERLA73DRAFT_87798 [Serpula lacrymans var. lacrymans S7.3]EGO26913.1 hypothetical protein SERLADRAFT_464529 [Serpula lacrymans var. lacrymans S7.9]
MSSEQHTHIPLTLRSALKQHSRSSSPSIPSPAPSSPSLSPALRPSPLALPPPASSLPPTMNSTGTSTPSISRSPSVSTALPTTTTVAAQGYTPKVSFDTFENPAASMFSFTLHVQSDGYARNRATRVFLCASSPDESGRQALDWSLESLVQDGDELIVFRGVDAEDLEKDHEVVRDEARELMRRIQEKCVEYDPDRKLSIIVEIIAGKVTTTIDRLIALYRPDSVVVGTRGQRGMIQAWGAAFGAPGVGSVSKYCLSHSPVPIIVVRPERNVKKVVAKRRADPKRGTHFDELTRTKTQNIQSLPMSSPYTR